jgi:hypothetical protein
VEARRTILVMIDALGYAAAREQCGYLEGLVEAGQARLWRMRSVLPSLSMPAYASLHTGTPPAEHGLVSNDREAMAPTPHVFSVVREAGLTTAAVAERLYAWLFNAVPFDPVEHLEVDARNEAGAPGWVTHGRFYTDVRHTRFNPHVPGDHDLCNTATLLIRRHAPDYMLVHSTAVDSVGHAFGADSLEYRHQVWNIDNELSLAIPIWQAAGYRVLVTSDHGMSAEGRHGGNEAAMRWVPFWDVCGQHGAAMDEEVSQLAVAPTILALMGLPVPETMREAPLV